MINAMLQQLEVWAKPCGFRKNLTAASPAVVKLPGRKSLSARVVGAALTIPIACFEKPGMRLHPGFFACGFHKNAILAARRKFL